MALDHKTRVSRATTTKAAHKRSQLGGERRDVTVAVARMAKGYEERIRELEVKLREERQKEKGTLARARRVLDDFFDSPEPRDMRHAMQALRAIICEGG